MESAPPPTYEEHEFDRPASSTEPAEPAEPDPVSAPLSFPLSLTYDEDLIYPTPPPSTALYHIPRSLSLQGTKVSVERSVPGSGTSSGSRSSRKQRDVALYDIIPTKPLSRNCEIWGTRRTSYPRAVMTGKRSMRGQEYLVTVRQEVVLRVCKQRWTAGNGRLLATETTSTTDMHAPDKPVLEILVDLDDKLRDLLVTAWCARIWRSSFAREKWELPHAMFHFPRHSLIS